MRCENLYCIYQKDFFCRNANVEIDKDGRCKQFLHLILDPRDIKYYKERTINLMVNAEEEFNGKIILGDDE